MFAYCGNSPTNNIDPSGTFYGRPTTVYMNDGGWGSGGSAGTTTGSYTGDSSSVAISAAVWTAGLYFASEVYDFAKQVKTELSDYGNRNTPHVHHIVPHGSFSSRNKTVSTNLLQAQNIMKRAGIDPKTNPLNLIVISSEYHRTLHTNNYLNMVSTAIIKTDGTKKQVKQALFMLRIIIAFGDPYALGY